MPKGAHMGACHITLLHPFNCLKRFIKSFSISSKRSQMPEKPLTEMLKQTDFGRQELRCVQCYSGYSFTLNVPQKYSAQLLTWETQMLDC